MTLQMQVPGPSAVGDPSREPRQVQVDGLSKTYAADDGSASAGGRQAAVDGVSFTVEPGKLFTLLGPSGCGKTTTLRSIAGLEIPDRGTIRVGRRVLFSDAERVNVPSESRGLGMVFQSYAIWPHMTVYQNVAFPFRVGRRRLRPSRQDARRRTLAALQIVGLADVEQRLATALSGGQQQRLALARALVMQPSVLLLDEPLSNLDAKLRESMRLELKRIQAEFGVTSIYVTHDQVEALAMSDVIAVMNEGVIEQVGTPDEVYHHPESRFVAEFIGSTNLLEGRSVSNQNGLTGIQTPAGLVLSSDKFTDDAPALVSVRPEDILLLPEDQTADTPNTWVGRVEARSFLGESNTYLVRAGQTLWQCKGTTAGGLSVGDEVRIAVPAGQVRIVPDRAVCRDKSKQEGNAV